VNPKYLCLKNLKVTYSPFIHRIKRKHIKKYIKLIDKLFGDVYSGTCHREVATEASLRAIDQQKEARKTAPFCLLF
jgi:hypothetical protein